ncbi:MAG: porin family protein [Chlorobiaceae bacterium]|nr:porin family protein [Chlorobiaceae bacterium]
MVVGLCSVPSLSYAAANPYVSVSGGLGLMNNSSEDGNDDAVEYNSGYLVNGAVGLKSDLGRIEAEVGYHRNGVDTYYGSPQSDTDVSVWSFMANGYLDFDMKDQGIAPYVMAGIGVADASIQSDTEEYGDTVFAWQVGAGVGIKAADKVSVDLGYRYFKPSDVTWDGSTYSLGSHNILAGIRYSL